VDPATKTLVLETATALSYQLNRIAQALRGARTKTIALVLPRVRGGASTGAELLRIDYYMHITASSVRAAMGHGYLVLLVPTIPSAQALRNMSVDGVIICDPEENDPRVAFCNSAQLPLVTIERGGGSNSYAPHVRADTEASINRLLSHMNRAGARRIALLGSTVGWSWAKESENAYRTWCAKNNVEPVIDVANVIKPHISSRHAARRLLRLRPRPDGIFAVEEFYASGVLTAARQENLNVPQDLLLAVGTDSTSIRFSNPAITAIDILPEVQGNAAVAMLVKLLGTRTAVPPRVIRSRLHTSQSTSSLSVSD
jgi:DNA-binding LacI/PurR family transcriptional regulator